MTRGEFEKALDERRLWINEWTSATKMRHYLVRRNGQTKLWKNSDRWEVPIKWKLNKTARINGMADLSELFTIQPGPDGPLVGEGKVVAVRDTR